MKQWSIGLMSNNEKKNILDQHRTLYSGYKTMQPEVSNTQPLYIQDFANDKGGVTVSNKGEVKRYTNVGINEQVEKESMCSECGGMVYEDECMECGYSGKEMGEETQQVKDLDNVEDLNLSDKFDYTEEEMYEDDAVDVDALQSVTGQDAPHDEDDMAPDGMDDDSDDYRHMMAYTEGEIDELSSHELQKGKKYKYRHPEFNDDLEYQDEYQDKHGGDSMYKFKSKDDTTHIMPNKSIEYFMDNLDDDDIDYNDMLAYSDEVEEQVGGGTAPSTNYSELKPAYNFISGGPLEEEGEDDNWEEIDVFSDVDDDLKESVTKQKNRIMEMMSRMKSYN